MEKVVCLNDFENFKKGEVYEFESVWTELLKDGITRIRVYIIYDRTHDGIVIYSLNFKKYFEEVL